MSNLNSRFTLAASSLDMRRSLFDRNKKHLFTMSAGKLYPVYCQEVLPGDTVSMDLSVLARMSTPIHPVMDDCYLDFYFFYCPNRQVWDHWKEFMGESPRDPYINPIQYTVPQLIPNSSILADQQTYYGYIPPKSILDYMGIPSNIIAPSINALPIRHFCNIWNEYFRDQNLQNAIDLDTSDQNLTYACIMGEGSLAQNSFWNGNSDNEAYVHNAQRGGDLPPVSKFHDYFTSALKQAQKGDPVAIPLEGFAPVYATGLFNLAEHTEYIKSGTGLRFSKVNGDPPDGDGTLYYNAGGYINTENNGNIPTNGQRIQLRNVGADLSAASEFSKDAGLAYSTITDLRYAFQMQKFLEADNRGGTRYRELIAMHFGVKSPDLEQQVPEYLGGKRIRVNMSQVLQTSATNDVSPQGNTAAYSLTVDRHSSFSKSFTEHGYVIGVCCLRAQHTYQQGINKMFSKKDKFDFYFPEFAMVSEQPILNKELYNPTYRGAAPVEPDFETANGVFGFGEAWSEYRFDPNTTAGEFRSTYAQSLDSWHYGDFYQSQPYLSSGWISEPRENIDRTLTVSSDVSDQLIVDLYFKSRWARILPMFSIPGLADHF